MRRLSKKLSVAAVVVSLAGCGQSTVNSGGTTPSGTDSSAVRSMSKAEAKADFDEISNSFSSLYGALDRKQSKYHFDFKSLVAKYRAQIDNGRNDGDYFQTYQGFLGEFHDPHISLQIPLYSDNSHVVGLPLLVMPIENTYVVYAVGSALAGKINVGDELLSVDGTSVSALVTRYSAYAGVANPLTAKHFASLNVTRRPVYLSNNLKANEPATLKVRDASGVTKTVASVWTEGARPVPKLAPAPAAGASTLGNATASSATAAEVTTAELTALGARAPFFMTPQVLAALGVTAEVQPSAAALTKFGLTADQAAAINYFAVVYNLGAKKVLFLRLPDYEPADPTAAGQYIRALLDEQQSQVDALILDETHNPGGNISFALDVATILAPKTFNGYVQEMHADRLWISTFATWGQEISQATGNTTDPQYVGVMSNEQAVDAAYSAKKSLSAPLPFFGIGQTFDADPNHWSKPVMMLADELSVSCADFVPLLFKANKFGTLFGQTTMGGGGNVEQVATLSNSQAVLSISRGLGTVYDASGKYPEANFIEDNGVSPNVSYSHTLADFRAGFVAYVSAFNATLALQLK